MSTAESAIKLPRPSLRRLNDGLSLVIVLLAIYIFIWPFLPQLTWWLRREAPVISAPSTQPTPAVTPVPQQNLLVIPKLDMRQDILEGPYADTVDRGVWRRPRTSVPSKGKNTVLVGHRFTYQGQSVFYHLDKLVPGDMIEVYWEQKKYEYVVTETQVVPATAIEIEAATDDPVLTLYTCTPLWSAKDRLVVRAKPKEPS